MEENYSEHTEETTLEATAADDVEAAETAAAEGTAAPLGEPEKAMEPEPETIPAEEAPERIAVAGPAPEEIKLPADEAMSREEVMELIRTEIAAQPKSSKSHPLMIAGLAALVGLGAGFGGGYAAYERL